MHFSRPICRSWLYTGSSVYRISSDGLQGSMSAGWDRGMHLTKSLASVSDANRYPRQKRSFGTSVQLLQGLSNRLMKPFQTSSLNQISALPFQISILIKSSSRCLFCCFLAQNPALLQHTYYFLIEINLKSPGILLTSSSSRILLRRRISLAIHCSNTSLLRQLCFGVCDC